jgi:hypothetical protein
MIAEQGEEDILLEEIADSRVWVLGAINRSSSNDCHSQQFEA